MHPEGGVAWAALPGISGLQVCCLETQLVEQSYMLRCSFSLYVPADAFNCDTDGISPVTATSNEDHLAQLINIANM